VEVGEGVGNLASSEVRVTADAFAPTHDSRTLASLRSYRLMSKIFLLISVFLINNRVDRKTDSILKFLAFFAALREINAFRFNLRRDNEDNETLKLKIRSEI
jgi:hypothetical protein